MFLFSRPYLLISIIFLAVFFYLYASLIQKKNKVLEAFASINVQLKKRYDLIPNILTIAQKFMDHERSLFDEITRLRTKALSLPDNLKSIPKKIEADNELKQKMDALKISVENYPELKSDNTMVVAMQTYNEVEEHIAASRRFYNAAVRELNNAVEIFPSSIIAAMLGIQTQSYFNMSGYEKFPISASAYLK